MKSGRNEKEIKEKGHFCTGPVTGFARACYLQRTYVTRMLRAKRTANYSFPFPKKNRRMHEKNRRSFGATRRLVVLTQLAVIVLGNPGVEKPIMSPRKRFNKDFVRPNGIVVIPAVALAIVTSRLNLLYKTEIILFPWEWGRLKLTTCINVADECN